MSSSRASSGWAANSVPRSKVTVRRASSGSGRRTSAMPAITAAERSSPFASRKVKRLLRSTSEVTFTLLGRGEGPPRRRGRDGRGQARHGGVVLPAHRPGRARLARSRGVRAVLLPTRDHEFTDDELAEGVSTAALVGMLLWLVPALLVLAPIAAVAALSSRPKRHDPLFVDPLAAVRVLDGEGAS